ncbi:hypothetical protein [Rhizocola hellebori]|nr:hypothetical protein [Rhizocola hellebori]
MSWTLRRFQIVTAVSIAVGWTIFWLVSVVFFGQPPQTAMYALVFSTVSWAGAALLVLRRWWSATGSGMASMDPPGRLLTAAVAALPERRRGWGMAMISELSEVKGRSARWRFALSSVRATLWLPATAAWPVFALVAGVVVAAALMAGPAVGARMPELHVFTVCFVGIFGAFVIVTLARSVRVSLSRLLPALLVTVAVAAAVIMTVIFLRRDPGAAVHLTPGWSVFLAAVLAGCLWAAVAAPQPERISRFAPYLGVGAALACVGGFWLLSRVAYTPRLTEALGQLPALLAVLWLLFVPTVSVFVVALAAASKGRSYHSGLWAGIWAGIASAPLMYGLWLYGSLHMYRINGGLFLFGDGAPEAENLSAALSFCLLLLVVFGPPFAVFGAATGLRLSHDPANSVSPQAK